ncbi:U3 small nucleolar RNA-associated protein 15 homolog [Uloborus diversus]|uniref:U3 small nucleolar RNA-associated protein 15 homolog n=1 Tax=Uloborus diversus TaxID=327109 RepID=UPI00240950DF|nr:U3 small nucleolar RNA-associated protein 15 homolog [Uloborus diversus]
MTDGLISFRHQKKDAVPKPEKKKNVFYQYRFYGTDFKPADGDIIVPESKKAILKKYENHLRKFESSLALDTVLKKEIQKNNPEIIISVMMELIRRGSIRAAMGGREGESLLKLLKFVTKYIGDPRFMRILIDIGIILIELYGPKFSDPETKLRFQFLFDAVENEIKYMKRMMEIQGVLHTVLASTFSADLLSNNKNVIS